MKQKLKIGIWYTNGDGWHLMIDPETNGIWQVKSDEEEDDESLNELLNYHLKTGVKRPEPNGHQVMIRPPSD